LSDIYSVSSSDWLGIIFRLCLALLFGAIIGLERELRHKPAGLRTHMLVSLGSAVFVLIPLQLVPIPDSLNELSRVIQGIAAGVGFLGGGVILRQSQHELTLVEVHGLTSAAAIWVAAALGIAAGCGLWQMGLISAVLSLVVLSIFKQLEKRS
jgi:putative Mg2+ transporter-C (MgtC) family protein